MNFDIFDWPIKCPHLRISEYLGLAIDLYHLGKKKPACSVVNPLLRCHLLPAYFWSVWIFPCLPSVPIYCFL